jgi:hypothetical protein
VLAISPKTGMYRGVPRRISAFDPLVCTSKRFIVHIGRSTAVTPGSRPGDAAIRVSGVEKRVHMLEIRRRLGSSPRERGSKEDFTCPDIFELADGRFAVVGTDMTAELSGLLPADAGVASYEKIVVVTRETLLHARADIPPA